MAILNNSNAISSGGYDINNSLRFRNSASAYLNRTPGSASNRKTWTWSAWVKRGTLTNGYRVLFMGGATDSDTGGTAILFNPDDTFLVQGFNTIWLQTSQVFRDPSAWYHFVVAFDSTNATANNRVRIYVNGSEITAFSTRTNLTLNTDYGINQAAAHAIGYQSKNWGWNYFDGYMADINFIDGQALTPSSFGETDTTTGVWKPKAYTGTYGTNGFELTFSDIATTSGSNAGLGKDFSGNTNYWTTNNISVTAGTTYDAMIDSPTLTSATVANYCVLNPLNKSGGITLSEANLRMSMDSATGYSARGTIASSSGKWYAEAFVQNKTTQTVIGVCDVTLGANQDPIVAPVNAVGYYANLGTKYVNGTSSAYGATYTTNDIIGIALDMDALTVTFYKNNTSQGSIALGTTGLNYTFFASDENSLNTQIQWNFGQRPFSYTPPTGFVRLNTYNLPDSTIKKGNTVMDATLYTGNGSTQTITNAASFKPDLVWLKSRSDAYDNVLIDSVRGTFTSGGNPYYGRLFSNTTAAQNVASLDTVTALNSNGFSVNSAGAGSYVNNTSSTYVGWQWQAGQGSTSSNTSGSITSTVSVNATAGFSIVTYTGTGANATVGHGLGVAPKMIICKNRTDVISWLIYHSSLGATKYLEFNTSAAVTATPAWNNTEPTSSVFTVGTYSNNNGSGKAIVAYCWAEIAGFSKFGSYTGNGSADGPFVYTGFRPKFIICKKTSDTSDWIINDTSRDTFNVTSKRLFTNTSDAESGTYDSYDILSNGFKMRNTNSLNISSASYIFMAFAENPFKNALAR